MYVKSGEERGEGIRNAMDEMLICEVFGFSGAMNRFFGLQSAFGQHGVTESQAQ